MYIYWFLVGYERDLSQTSNQPYTTEEIIRWKGSTTAACLRPQEKQSKVQITFLIVDITLICPIEFVFCCVSYFVVMLLPYQFTLYFSSDWCSHPLALFCKRTELILMKVNLNNNNALRNKVMQFLIKMRGK